MPAIHIEIIKLVIAYTLVGAFVFTVIITLGSLVGLIKFADKHQQHKLFTILIVQLVIAGVAFFTQMLTLSPNSAIQKIGNQAVSQLTPPPVQDRINTLLDKIDKLPDAAAVELGKNPPVIDPDIDKIVVLRDPTNQRLTDGKVARQTLKMQAVLGGKRSEQELAAWEAAVKSTQ